MFSLSFDSFISNAISIQAKFLSALAIIKQDLETFYLEVRPGLCKTYQHHRRYPYINYLLYV